MQESQDWFKVTLLFPLRDNDGNPFAEDVWGWWMDEMNRFENGFTDLGVVEGWWRGKWDQNQTIVMIVKTENEVGAIREFLRLARPKFGQDVMYLDYHPVHFEEVQ